MGETHGLHDEKSLSERAAFMIWNIYRKTEAGENYMENKKMEDKVFDQIQMMVSGRLKKGGKEIVRVSFFRGKDYADGVLPDCVIEKAEGFTDAEKVLLAEYLKQNRKEIYAEAKEIDPMKKWLGLK